MRPVLHSKGLKPQRSKACHLSLRLALNRCSKVGGEMVHGTGRKPGAHAATTWVSPSCPLCPTVRSWAPSVMRPRQAHGSPARTRGLKSWNDPLESDVPSPGAASGPCGCEHGQAGPWGAGGLFCVALVFLLLCPWL